MDPIKTNEANFTYLGPGPDVADLPCRLEGANTFCVWELSDEERKQIAGGARLRLGIYGARPIPPVSLQVVANAGPYERVAAPCDVCGKEPDDVVHDEGPGTHAFRQRKKDEPPAGPWIPKKYG